MPIFLSLKIPTPKCLAMQYFTINPLFKDDKLDILVLTQEYLVKGESPPECIPCNYRLSVKYVLIECAEFNDCEADFNKSPLYRTLLRRGCHFRIFESSCAVHGFMKNL